MLSRSVVQALRSARPTSYFFSARQVLAQTASYSTHTATTTEISKTTSKWHILRRPQKQSVCVRSQPITEGRRQLSDNTRSAIGRAVASAPVVLFMKGTPELPQCGFSRASIQILGLQGVNPDKFAAFNVLEDPELRAGIKEYSDWPTIPQLYVDGEFVGGCDILIAMHQGGDLAKLFEEKKVLISASGEEGEGESDGETKA